MFPYLRLPQTVTVGPWEMRPIDVHQLSAAGTPEATWIAALLARLRDPKGKELTAATMISRRDATPPADQDSADRDLRSLEAAVAFAVADANSTSDNSIDWERPVLTVEVSHLLGVQMSNGGNAPLVRRSGGPIFSVTSLGGSVFDDWVILPCPEGLMEIHPAALDPVLLNAAYDIDRQAWEDFASSEIRSVASALHWHARAWENSPQHTMPDVVVQLKTAIEALSGEHRTANGIPRLESIYRAIEDTVSAGDYLWDKDAPTVTRRHGGKVKVVSAFADWYWELANLRNGIVHDGRNSEMNYEQPSSPFNGNVFQISERVTRELIKIRLAQLGHRDSAVSVAHRRLFADGVPAEFRRGLTVVAPMVGDQR
jgi:hypothetical protein